MKSEILALEDKIVEADSSPAPDTSAILDELLDDEVILIGPEGRDYSKKFVLDAHRPPKKQPFDSVKIRDRVIKEFGTTAFVVCTGEFRAKDKTFTLRFSRVWNKKDGSWMVVLATVTAVNG